MVVRHTSTNQSHKSSSGRFIASWLQMFHHQKPIMVTSSFLLLWFEIYGCYYQGGNIFVVLELGCGWRLVFYRYRSRWLQHVGNPLTVFCVTRYYYPRIWGEDGLRRWAWGLGSFILSLLAVLTAHQETCYVFCSTLCVRCNGNVNTRIRACGHVSLLLVC